jgi:hypothetical protein
MTERQIEMLWKCSSCGARSLGRHTTCQSCGNPKDGSEEWFMPEGPAPTVTDPALLALATAGANWRCAYCGSDQRAGDGRCAQCGAAQKEGTSLDAKPGAPPEAAAAPAAAPAPEAPKRSRFPRVFWVPLISLWVVGVTLLGLIDWSFPSQSTVEAKVASSTWLHTVSIERKQRVPKEGFAEKRPLEAEDVVSLGPRHHHDDQVADGTHTESYSVTVPDGYRTETYTENERCGETCTTRAKTCREVCTSNKNGFATCKPSCSGGGRDCSPKYCNKTKTRKIAKTKSENRTRVVTTYKTVPRDAEYFTWKEWVWLPHRTVDASGTTEALRWPDEHALAPPAPLAPGEEERSSRSARYEVTFETASKEKWKHPVATEAEFLRFKSGEPHRLQVVGGALTAVDPAQVLPSVVPLRYRPQLWFPIVLVMALVVVLAARRWPHLPDNWLHRLMGVRLQTWARRLRHVLGLAGLLLAHFFASSPLELVVQPGRGLDAFVNFANRAADPSRWDDGSSDEVSTWVVLAKARWTAYCRTEEQTAEATWKVVAEGPCSGDGPPPPLPARAAGCEGDAPPAGCQRAQRDSFNGTLSLVRLPSGRSFDGLSPYLLSPASSYGYGFETQRDVGTNEARFAEFARAEGRLYSALWTENRGQKVSVTLRTAWP